MHVAALAHAESRGTRRSAVQSRTPPASARQRVLRRSCACGGSCPACDDPEKKRLLPRLQVGAVADPLEAEADRVATAVMSGEAGGQAGGQAGVQAGGKA